jgi:uncharacterized membrane protein
MNDAHLHMIVNHFPIVGPILGLLVLIGGMFFKDIPVKNTAYLLFILSAIFTVFSMATGEGAEKIAEDMLNIDHHVIHEHEEYAEKFAIIIYLLGIVSILGLITNIKNHPKATFFAYTTATIALVAIVFATKVGTSGGEIRHTEIRDDAVSTKINIQNSELTKHDD